MRGRQALAASLVGLAGGGAYAALAAAVSPLVVMLSPLAAAAVAGAFLSATHAFYATAAVIPIERFGRFTPDSAMVTFSLMRLVGSLALAATFVALWRLREPLRLGPAVWLYTAYAGCAALTLAWTSDWLGTVRAMGAIVGNLMFLVLVMNAVRDMRIARIAIAVWLASSVAAGLYTIYDWHLGGEAGITEFEIGESENRFSTTFDDVSEWEALDNPRRAAGLTSHSAVYGINLLLTVPFFLWLASTARARWAQAACWAGLAIVGYNVLLTNTRATILLAGVVLVASGAVGLYRLTPRRVAAGLLLALAALPFVPSDVYERVLDLDNYSVERSGTLRIRFDYWNAATEVIGEHWFGGVGVGNQQEVPKRLKTVGPKETTAHNEFLQTMMEVGVLGFAAWLGFIAYTFVVAVRSARQRAAVPGDDPAAPAAPLLFRACAVATACTAVYGLQVDVWHFPLKGWWLAAGIACALAARRLNQERSR